MRKSYFSLGIQKILRIIKQHRSKTNTEEASGITVLSWCSAIEAVLGFKTTLPAAPEGGRNSTAESRETSEPAEGREGDGINSGKITYPCRVCMEKEGGRHPCQRSPLCRDRMSNSSTGKPCLGPCARKTKGSVPSLKGSRKRLGKFSRNPWSGTAHVKAEGRLQRISEHIFYTGLYILGIFFETMQTIV